MNGWKNVEPGKTQETGRTALEIRRRGTGRQSVRRAKIRRSVFAVGKVFRHDRQRPVHGDVFLKFSAPDSGSAGSPETRTSSASTSWLVKQGTDLQYDGPDDHRPVSTTVRHRPAYRKDSRSVQKAQGRCGRIHRTLLPREHKIHSARRRTIYLDRTSDRGFRRAKF